MGVLLVTLFVVAILVVAGGILAFTPKTNSRKTGLVMLAVALLLGAICIFAKPNANESPWTGSYSTE